MRRSEKRQKFSIRKFNVGVASALIGATIIGLGLPNQLAKADVTQPASAKTINARYVLTSELTADEIKLIQLHLPSQTVDCTDDYYMVYRPTASLPATGINESLTGLALGGGLLLVGIALGKNRKNRLISSAFLVTATGLVGVSSVSAIQSQALSAYNQTLTLKVGDQLPQLAVAIPNHEFMGYILVGDCDLTDVVAEPIAEQAVETAQEKQEVNPTGGAAAAGQEETKEESETVQSEVAQPIVEPASSEEMITPSETVIEPSQPVTSQEPAPAISETIVEESQVVTSEVVSEVVVPVTSEVVVETVTSEVSEVIVEVVTSEVSQVIDEETSEVSEIVVEIITSEVSETVVEVVTSEVSEIVIGESTSEVISEVLVPEVSERVEEVSQSQVVEEPAPSESASQEPAVISSETKEPEVSETVQSQASEVSEESTSVQDEVSQSESQTAEVVEESTSVQEEVSQSEIISEEVNSETSESEEVSEAVSESQETSSESQELTSETSESAEVKEEESELPVVVVDKTLLQEDYQSTQGLVEEDYSPESWKVLQTELAKAEAVLANETVDQATVDLAKAELDSAIAALAVEKTYLKELLAEAQNKVSTNYSPESWRTLLETLTNAQVIFDDIESKQSAVNQHSKLLRAALDKLTVDKSELIKLLSDVDKLVDSDYSPATWSVLKAAQSSSTDVKEDDSVVQSTVDKSVAELQTAIDQLGVDKSDLAQLLSEVAKLTATDYSDKSWSVLADEETAAKTINSSDKSVQSEIDQAVTDLQAAIKQLTVDTKALEDLVEEATALNQSDYRKNTWSVLADELTNSKALLSSQKLKQSEVNQAVETLQEAIEKLALRLVAPTLVYKTVETDAMDKSLTVTYSLEDKDKTLTSVTFALYDGEDLMIERTIDVNDEQTATLTYYDTDYTLKTSYTYDLQEGDGKVTEVLEDKIVAIELKKIEIKDIDSLTLYRFDDEAAAYNRVSTLSALPENTDEYFVLIQSDIYKDMLLPVSSIEETTTSTGATAYKVQVALDELVQDMDDSAISDYVDQFSFTIGQTPEAEENVITSFSQLVAAIDNDPAGTYYLGANLFADDVELADDQVAYISQRFTGRLVGEHQGQQYTIYNLEAPLFAEVYIAEISHLDLKSVNISTTNSSAAALALTANGSQFKDISVAGQVIAKSDVAGLVAKAAQSLFEDVAFQGNLVATARDENVAVGGIVAEATNTAIRKAAADVNISTYTDNRLASVNNRTGGIVGRLFNKNTLLSIKDLYAADYNVENAVVTGQINHYGQAGNIGGIVGSTRGETEGTIHNVLSALDKNSGNQITGLGTASQAYVLGESVGTAQTYEVTNLSQTEADAQAKAMGITTSLDDSLLDNTLTTDYTSLRKATADRETAYKNIALLMPFYNKEQVVKYGNKVATSDKLYTTDILSVTPMVGDAVVADLAINKEKIDQIMIHYADGTVDYRSVSYAGDFKNTGISEYTISGTDLIYTPETLLSTYDSIINAVKPLLTSLDYYSEEVAKAIGAYSEEEVAKLVEEGMSEADARAALTESSMGHLYLEAAFAYIQDDIDTFLRQILSTSNSVNTTGGVVDKVLIDYISDNKEKLLLGLSYVIRWYDINFGETNIENLAAYYQDFFGKPVNTLEWLVSIADLGYDNIRLANNLTTYAQSIAPNNAYGHLLDYLTANRKLFTDYETDNDWFKDATTAYIQEVASEAYPDADYSVYGKLSHPEQANGILPLLTADEGIYLISNMASITYGMFATYMDMDLADTDTEAYQEALELVQGLVDRAALAQAQHLDAMSQVFDTFGDMSNRVLPVWDAYLKYETDEFIDLYGPDATQAMLDFFGPIERANTEFEAQTGAYAKTNDNMYSQRGEAVHFVKTRLLEDYGLSVYTHELVHIFDRMIYLNSEGRRSGQDPESYATGLLESPTYPYEAIFGFNTIHDWSENEADTDRYHNISADRFQSSDDLQAYASGVLDVIYLLDVAEANAVIGSGTSTMRNWYRKVYNTNATSQVLERIRTLNNTELAKIKTWEDLVNNNIVDRRTPTNFSNSYYEVPLFSSNYSALMNEQGTTAGQMTFRRLAYEILAAAGKDGFIAYTSDQEMGDDTAIVAVLSKLLGTNYTSYADFKIDQIQKRVDQAANLATVDIEYQGQTVTISSFDQLQELMAEAVAYDVKNNRMAVNNSNSRVYELKSAIYNAYLRQTNDFTTSIFN